MIQSDFLSQHPFYLKFAVTLLVLIGTWGIMRFILYVTHSKMENMVKFYTIRKTSNYIYTVFVFLFILVYWAESIKSLSTFMGLFSAGLAIALRDLIMNIAGWIFITTRKPFSIKDRIEINGFAGDVIDIRLFSFSLMEIGNWVVDDQSTGRIINIPNAIVLSHPLANYNQGFRYIWNEINLTLTFESNWEKAKSLLTEIVERHSEHIGDEAQESLRKATKKYMIFYSNLTPIVYTNVVEYGIAFSLRYLCEPRKRRTTKQEIWEEILRTLSKHDDISLAYNTQRIVFDNKEKAGL